MKGPIIKPPADASTNMQFARLNHNEEFKALAKHLQEGRASMMEAQNGATITHEEYLEMRGAIRCLKSVLDMVSNSRELGENIRKK